MAMFGKKEPQMPAELGDIPSRPPVEYEPPNLQEDGTARDAAIQAAREYDRLVRAIAEKDELLRRSFAEVKAAQHQIDELKLSLAEERNHVASYKAERDEAIQDRANVVAILANIDAIIDRGIRDGDIPRKSRRNGKHALSADASNIGVGGASDAVTHSGGAVAPLPASSGGTVEVRLSDEKGSRD